MAGNRDLRNANKAKKDEFYTQLSDIEKELRYYKDQFKDKVIFCNCDDPYESNFFKYFALNFNYLGLKKLIATCYFSSPVIGKQLSLFDIVNINTRGSVHGRQPKKPYFL
ncbi:modification methylase EcoRI [Clostridium perfringens D str. JGS1721]|uniref:Modification methylase EcoRI n=1 Tax=Clostridium perfringens D str. JGS1721 TaxID=488537 RepID=B1V882_CLOPF|nr:modification methylase EcoRI [Clostridium perfringens D str. JGS1721]